MPATLAYLREWMFLVHGQSGFTMDGPIPATFDTIRKVAAAVGIHPPPTEDEMIAVRELDTAFIIASRPKLPAKPTTSDTLEIPRGHRRG